jgi:hypothetical protein
MIESVLIVGALGVVGSELVGQIRARRIVR